LNVIGSQRRDLYLINFISAQSGDKRTDKTVFFNVAEGARAVFWTAIRRRPCDPGQTVCRAKHARPGRPDTPRAHPVTPRRTPRAILYLGTIKMLCTPRGAALLLAAATRVHITYFSIRPRPLYTRTCV